MNGQTDWQNIVIVTETGIKSLPESDRPRERMLQHGPDSVSSSELIAIILGSGMKGKSVLALAGEILCHFGSLEALAKATIEELCQIKGMGKAKAIQLLAAITLGNRLKRQPIEQRPHVGSPTKAYQLVRDRLQHEDREFFVILLLDLKNYLICQEIVSVGTLTKTLVHPREVFHPAIRHKAASVILVHNHPSGDPTPSKEDIELTEQLDEIGKMMSIPVHDHLIIGRNDFTSLRQTGVIGKDEKKVKIVKAAVSH